MLRAKGVAGGLGVGESIRRSRSGWTVVPVICALFLTLSAEALGPEGALAEETAARLPSIAALAPEERSLWNPLTWQWVPTAEEIQKYRRSWNPMTHGPILNTGIDIQPKGQFLIQPFFFGEVAHLQYPNTFGTGSVNAPTHLRGAISPTVIFAYGITDHLELNVAPSWIYFDAQTTHPNGTKTRTSDNSIGDTTIYLKYRPIVQDPDTWRPSVTIYNGITLPSSRWFATTGIPGGFAPLGRLPGTKFGGLSISEGLMFRKNLKPFRFNAAVYYSYTAPGTNAGLNTYNGDIINTRFIVEYVANEARGLVFAAEFLTLNGLSWRLDGHPLNVTTQTGATTFNLVGVQPTIEYKFFHDDRGALVAAAGVLFSIAGQNEFNAIYPNFSMYYYWSKKGKPLMR